MGATGLHTLGAILYSKASDSEWQLKKCIKKVLSPVRLYETPEKLEDELIYGSAGYLYCLLLIKKHFSDRF